MTIIILIRKKNRITLVSTWVYSCLLSSLTSQSNIVSLLLQKLILLSVHDNSSEDKFVSYCCAWPYVVYIYMLYVHNPESARKILQTILNVCLGKLTHRLLDSSTMKKIAADLKAKGKKPGSTTGLLAS